MELEARSNGEMEDSLLPEEQLSLNIIWLRRTALKEPHPQGQALVFQITRHNQKSRQPLERRRGIGNSDQPKLISALGEWL